MVGGSVWVGYSHHQPATLPVHRDGDWGKQASPSIRRGGRRWGRGCHPLFCRYQDGDLGSTGCWKIWFLVSWDFMVAGSNQWFCACILFREDTVDFPINSTSQYVGEICSGFDYRYVGRCRETTVLDFFSHSQHLQQWVICGRDTEDLEVW